MLGSGGSAGFRAEPARVTRRSGDSDRTGRAGRASPAQARVEARFAHVVTGVIDVDVDVACFFFGIIDHL